MSLVKVSEDINNKRVNYLIDYKGKLVEFYTLQVNPVVITPECIKQGLIEDCFNCSMIDTCSSPRGWCIKPYKGHYRGCKNYGNNEGCPPNVPMFNEVFDMTKSVYLGINDYDTKEHKKRAIKNHPEWNQNQAGNTRHYQPYMQAINNRALREWLKSYPDLVATNWIESMGVDLVKTLRPHGIELKFGEEMDITRRIILMGSLIHDACEKNDLVVVSNNNVRTLRLKKYM